MFVLCKSKIRYKYLPEPEVIKQISAIIDDLDLGKINLGYKIQQELERYSHFQSKVLGITEIESKKKKRWISKIMQNIY